MDIQHQTKAKPVTLLILGAGWTSNFLIPLLKERNVSFAATSTTGRPGTLPFKFDPSSTDTTAFKSLPAATTVLVTFPLTGPGQSKLLVSSYAATHPATSSNFIQLGSSGIWQIEGQETWVNRKSPYNRENARAVAEDELLGLGGCVLNLSGLWGGGQARHPRNWIARIAKSKKDVEGKGSLHLVHGQDVARAILAVTGDFTKGERWMITDLFVYDWWSLIMGWSGEDDKGEPLQEQPYIQWVRELMEEKGIRALPRSTEDLGRAYDAREFWTRFNISPVKGRVC